MPTKWYEGEVIRILDETSSTKRFFIKVLDTDQFTFTPGQFITFDLPLGEKRLQRWRSYSIASISNQENILELCIVHLEGGLASNYLWKINPGDTLKFKGPDGGFVLPSDVSDREIIMIATGTGVAPFRSMLLDFKSNPRNYKSIHLIFGTRYASGILYQEEFENLKKILPNFEYSIALSQEPETEFFKGHVHHIYKSFYKEMSSNRHFYLCGWSNMVDQAVETLFVELGYPREQIHFELYG
jgi:ferredoxin-NADP reductase